MIVPRDPYSEVVDERRRWWPEWYSWLLDLDRAISAGRLQLNIDWDGVDPSGVADSTVGLQRMLDQASGYIWWVPGDYKISGTLVQGDGSASAFSTKYGLRHIGLASLQVPGLLGWTTTPRCVRLKWAGAANGTMWVISGPLSGWGFENFMFDAVGANTAGTGLVLYDAMGGYCSQLYFSKCAQVGVLSYARGAFTAGLITNTMHNTWIGLTLDVPVSGFGIWFNSAGGSTNSCYEDITNLLIQFSGGSAKGIIFGACDSIQIRNCHCYHIAGAGQNAVVYDYSNGVTTVWPTGCTIWGIDPGLSPIINVGTPGALPQNNLIYGFNKANGAVVPVLAGLTVV